MLQAVEIAKRVVGGLESRHGLDQWIAGDVRQGLQVGLECLEVVFGDALVAQLRGLQAGGWSLLVTTSRRSDPAVLPRLQQALAGDRGFVWDRTGESPYFQYLAITDAVLVTVDSITMTCEAASTGLPVFSIPLDETPGAYLDKFHRFHRDMQETLGVTRPFAGTIEPYSYTPLDEAGRIAGIIRDRLAGRPRRP